MEQVLGIIVILIIYLVSRLLRATGTPMEVDELGARRSSESEEDLGEAWQRVKEETAHEGTPKPVLAPSLASIVIPTPPPPTPVPSTDQHLVPESPSIRPSERRAPTSSVFDWLNRDGLRKAILAAEILGPCRARRPFRKLTPPR